MASARARTSAGRALPSHRTRASPAALMATQVARPSLPGGLLGYLSMERSPSALAELDGLRAVAILLVLARHAVRRFYERRTAAPADRRLGRRAPLLNGWIGVDLFFVLSGFLVSGHLLAGYGRSERAGAGALSRQAGAAHRAGLFRGPADCRGRARADVPFGRSTWGCAWPTTCCSSRIICRPTSWWCSGHWASRRSSICWHL